MNKEQGQDLKPPFSWHDVIRDTKKADLNLTGLNVFISKWENLDEVFEGFKIKFISISDGDFKGLPKGIYIETNVLGNSLNDTSETKLMHELISYFLFNILSEVNTTKTEISLPNNFKKKNKLDKSTYIDTSEVAKINGSFLTSRGCTVYEILPVSLSTILDTATGFINGKVEGSIEMCE